MKKMYFVKEKAPTAFLDGTQRISALDSRKRHEYRYGKRNRKAAESKTFSVEIVHQLTAHAFLCGFTWHTRANRPAKRFYFKTVSR